LIDSTHYLPIRWKRWRWRDLCEALDGEQQLWLISWWQHRLWRSGSSAVMLKRLDTLRGQLLSFVQPRLAWEVALLDLTPSVS